MSYESDRPHYRYPPRHDYYKEENSSEAHHGYAQRATQTPFTVLCQHFEALCNTTGAQNLLASEPDHFLTRAIENLRVSANAVGAQHGRLGPDTTWNSPWTGHGPRLNTDPQFPRPHTPNSSSGLHPPHTPPHTPDMGGDGWSKRHSKQVSQLEADVETHKLQLEQLKIDFRNEQDDHSLTKRKLEKIRQQLERSERTLAKANKITTEQHEEIKALHSNIESLTSALANEYVEASRLEDAANQYDSLVQLKAKEMKRRRDDDDQDGLRQAEMAKLGYLQEKARVLVSSTNASVQALADAHDTLAFVLGRRRELYPDDDLFGNDNREAHLLQAEALMRSMDSKQMAAAESMYERFASLRRLEGLNDVDRIWALRNASGLADAQARQRYSKDATSQLKKVWLQRHQAPRHFRAQLEKQLLETASLLSCQDSKYAVKAMETVCDGEPSKHTLRLWTKLGIMHHDFGHQEDALQVLQTAWARKRDMTVDEQRSTAWALARTQGARNKWQEVQPLLSELDRYDNTSSGPLEDEIIALRAAMELNLGAYKDAEATATALYKKWGVSNVLHPSSMFHHIDTLIRAKTKQKKLDKFEEARKLWAKVYDRRKDEQLDAVRGAELMKLCASAKMLANQWEETRKQSGRRLKSVEEIREQVGVVENMLS